MKSSERWVCPKGCQNKDWACSHYVDYVASLPPQEETIKILHNAIVENAKNMSTLPPISSDWKEEEREAWRKAVKELSNNFYSYGSIEKLANWWLERMALREKEIKKQCVHEDDYRITEQFNRGLKNENGELVQIIKDGARSSRDSEWKAAIKELATTYITSNSARNALADLLDKMSNPKENHE